MIANAGIGVIRVWSPQGFFSGVLAAALSVSSATADDNFKAIEAFYGTCLAHGPDFERTIAAAKMFKWKPIPEEMKSVVGPGARPDAFEGWLAGSSTGFPPKSLVGITKARNEGKPIEVCTIAFMDADGIAVERLFIDRMKPKKIGEEADGMQVFKAYTLSVGTSMKPQTVTITRPQSGPGVVLGSIIDK
jgi:hypothetical protein